MDPNNWAKRNFRRFMNDLTSQYPEIPVLTPHELRHTRATLWWEEKVDLLSLGMVGGWRNLRMLRERYAHSNIDHLKKLRTDKGSVIILLIRVSGGRISDESPK